MRILFCNIAWMKYYKGTCDDDTPVNGGSYVDEHKDGIEAFNFLPITVENDDVKHIKEGSEVLFGSFETKSNKKSYRPNQVHIERFEGCNALTKGNYVDDVLVIWCATSPKGESKVVGWYKNATVHRRYESIEIACDDDSTFERWYNVTANVEDAMLLPESERNRNIWKVPRKNTKRGTPFGFFRANHWYASEPEAQEYVRQLVSNIDNYSGKNAMNI